MTRIATAVIFLGSLFMAGTVALSRADITVKETMYQSEKRISSFRDIHIQGCDFKEFVRRLHLHEWQNPDDPNRFYVKPFLSEYGNPLTIEIEGCELESVARNQVKIKNSWSTHSTFTFRFAEVVANIFAEVTEDGHTVSSDQWVRVLLDFPLPWSGDNDAIQRELYDNPGSVTLKGRIYFRVEPYGIGSLARKPKDVHNIELLVVPEIINGKTIQYLYFWYDEEYE